MKKKLEFKKKIYRSIIISIVIVVSWYTAGVANDLTRTAKVIDGRGVLTRTVDKPFVCHYGSKSDGLWEDYCNVEEYLSSWHQKLNIGFLFFIFIALIPLITLLQVAYWFVRVKV